MGKFDRMIPGGVSLDGPPRTVTIPRIAEKRGTRCGWVSFPEMCFEPIPCFYEAGEDGWCGGHRSLGVGLTVEEQAELRELQERVRLNYASPPMEEEWLTRCLARGGIRLDKSW